MSVDCEMTENGAGKGFLRDGEAGGRHAEVECGFLWALRGSPSRRPHAPC